MHSNFWVLGFESLSQSLTPRTQNQILRWRYDLCGLFQQCRGPATGLTPTIGVYKQVSDATDVTPAPTVSEIGGGFYKFSASPAEALVVRMNGGGSLSDADKYKVMQITPHDADLDAQGSTRGSQANLTAVQAAVAALNHLTVGEIWAGTCRTTWFPANSLADLAQTLLGPLQPLGDHRCERGLYGLRPTA